MSRLFRVLNGPKALLPLWLLALIVLGATAVAAAAGEAGLPPLAAAAIAAVVSWGASLQSRVVLARRGRTGYEDMPSADLEYNDSPGVQGVAEMLNTFGWFGSGLAAGALVRAAGLDPGGEIWVVPTWVFVGFVAAAPVLTETDARYGLWVRRRRLREEEAIRGSGTEESPAPDTDPAAVTVIPLNRAKIWAFVAMALALAAVCGGFGVLGTDISIVERVLMLLGVPLFVGAAVVTGRLARAPHFLRLTRTGADLMGAGEIPWSAIGSADVSAHSAARWLALALKEPVGDQPWATPRLRRMTKRSGGDDAEAMLRFSARPAPEIMAAIRATGRVETEAYLA